MSISYTLNLQNNSAMPWTFYVYQLPPNQGGGNVFSLAWLASPFTMVPGAGIAFTWTTDYGFVWSATGQVRPGIAYNASQIVPGGLTADNTIQFANPDNTPQFTEAVTGNPAGSLVIADAADVPNNVFSVGVAMSGAAAFITPAGPNLTHVFTPSPSYWIAAGTNVEVGTVLDTETISQNTQVVFPANIYKLTYSLGQDNTWKQV